MAITVTVKTTNGIATSIARIKRKLSAVPRRAYKEWLRLTPVRSGKARRNTKLRGKNTIHANYEYAHKLDEGYSKQAPDGMSKPTEEFIQKEVQTILRRK